MHYARQRVRQGLPFGFTLWILFVRDIGGHYINGIGEHGHRQLVQIAVVENAAAGRYLKGALLLLGGAVDEIFVMNDLQPDQPATDDDEPANEEEGNV